MAQYVSDAYARERENEGEDRDRPMRYEILKFTTKKLFKQMRLIYQNTCFPENKTNLYVLYTHTRSLNARA